MLETELQLKHAHHRLYKTPLLALDAFDLSAVHKSSHPFQAYEYQVTPHLVRTVGHNRLLADHDALLQRLDAPIESPVVINVRPRVAHHHKLGCPLLLLGLS